MEHVDPNAANETHAGVRGPQDVGSGHQWAVEAHALTKFYPLISGWKDLLWGRKQGPCAVDQVNLHIKNGELFGLVGPNGAGKTTLIKMLTTLVLPTSGSIRIAGYDIRNEEKVKKAIGLSTSDERSFYWRLTGRQNLRFFAGLHNIPARKAEDSIQRVLSQLGLTAVADKRFHTYSTGLRQRLAIARALLTEPRVIFMDEPTKGLDPLAANSLHKLIREHLIDELGVTVFLTSHHLTEIEKICDRIAIMQNGKIRACGTMSELRRLMGPAEKYRVIVEGLSREKAEPIAALEDGVKIFMREEQLQLEFVKDDADELLMKVISAVQARSGKIKSAECTPVSLDALFRHLTLDCLGESNRCPPVGEDEDLKFVGEPQLGLNDDLKHTPLGFGSKENPTLKQWIMAKVRAAHALFKRDMLSETSYRFSLFMQIVEILMTVAALFFLSRLVGQDTIDKYLTSYNGNYFAFAIIGVAFYGYFNVGFSTFANQLNSEQMSGTLESMLSTPVGLSTIVLGSSLWRFAMTTIRVLVILVAGSLMIGGGMVGGSPLLVVLIMAMTVISASSFGIIAACFIIVVKRGDPISWIFKAASWMIGGVVFPVTVLPSWLQKFAILLPTTHALQALRMVMINGKNLNSIWPEITSLAIFCFILLPISLKTLQYSVNRAKKEGTLTHY
jgi:ABC-type multidrug transport system ATPase subunit/ABC-type multidrug transport system permease subunit